MAHQYGGHMALHCCLFSFTLFFIFTLLFFLFCAYFQRCEQTFTFALLPGSVMRECTYVCISLGFVNRQLVCTYNVQSNALVLTKQRVKLDGLLKKWNFHSICYLKPT